MKLNRDQLVQFIRNRGDDENADKAAQELPETLELPQDEGRLAQYGVHHDDIDDASVWGEKKQ